MKYKKWIAVIVIIITVIFDALRDAWWNTTTFWKCHIPKEISFLLPICFILWLVGLQWYWIVVLAVICHFLWKYVAKSAGMATAGSLWKKIWGWIKNVFRKR